MRIQHALSLLALTYHWTSLVHAIDGSFSAEAVETNAGWSDAELDFIFAQPTPEYEPDMLTTKADISETTNRYKGIFALDNKLVSSKQKQKAVKDAFVFAWEGYKKYSWGADENKPVSKGTENSRNGWGATIVDALDTLHIMGLHEDFSKATNYVAAIDWSSSDVTMEVQVFETVIRYVGGLLSAYDLSGNPVFVERARDLVDRLLPAFDTPTGIPYHSIHLDTGRPSMNGYIKPKYLGSEPMDISDYVSILSEAGTVQLELNRLSDITGDPKYHLAVSLRFW
ncbi:hypothetical protein INT43_000561 [Umbelopsis isabellina]|uniref:alpha-1,2-Mannosidase n=1 Tax=Mortierella isabellina TaxID=91625 RepID=A0A8H7Q3I4_MORIS|nr:hypothetical protein INT43_000561 [Umbelopsis isabellina]